MTWRVSLVFIMVSVVVGKDTLRAQEPETIREGDSTVAARILAETREWYPNFRPAGAAITSTNPLGLAGSPVTTVRGFSVNGRLSRMVVSAVSPAVVCGTEFYFLGDSLRMTFESCEFPDGSMAPTTRRNFWGLRSWERRVYFQNDAVAFVETSGKGAPDHERGAALLQAFRQSRAVLPRSPG